MRLLNAVCMLNALSCCASLCCAADSAPWKKHVVMERGHCNTAVALDANGDKALDVIASFDGRVSLFIAPDWQTDLVDDRFAYGRLARGKSVPRRRRRVASRQLAEPVLDTSARLAEVLIGASCIAFLPLDSGDGCRPAADRS